MRLRSSLPLAAVALATGIALTSLNPAGAAGSADPRVHQGPSASLLPSWARSATITGPREVWLLPAYDAGEPSWDTDSLLGDINAELGWFTTMSRGRFTLTATRVLEPLHFDSGDGSACDAAARVLAPAISRFYATAPAGAYLVALTRSSDCPYSAIGDTPGRSLIVTGFSIASLASEHHLLHEIGHNLGLPHSSGYAGALLSSTAEPGRISEQVLEYGSTTDVMGSPGSSMRLSAPSLAALGWGDGVQQIPAQTRATYALTLPEVSRPGPDAAMVDDPVSGTRYILTYVDDPRQTAPGMPTAGRGVFLHEVALNGQLPGDYGRASLSYQLPWESQATGCSLGIGAGPGTSWISPTGTVGMRVVALSDEGARIEVDVDPQGGLTDTSGPAWPLAPSVEVNAALGKATVQLPAAWDQSGVVSYRVLARGASVISVRTPRDLVFAGSATLSLTRARAVVRVIATDGTGNSTTWTQVVRAHR